MMMMLKCDDYVGDDDVVDDYDDDNDVVDDYDYDNNNDGGG